MANKPGWYGDEDRKSKQAYVQHHGPVMGRIRYLLGGLFG